MTVRKPTLPSVVWDALPADLAADYNRGNEAEPAPAVAVVVNVNLNYDVQSIRQDNHGRAGVPMPVLLNLDGGSVARQVEQVRQAITAAMRGEVA